MEQLQKYEARITFLHGWNESLATVGGFENEDRIYQNSVEIEAKQHFIESYKKHTELAAEGREAAAKYVNDNMAGTIKELRAVILEGEKGALKKGILQRYKNGKYKGNEMIADYNNAVKLIG